MDLSDGEAEIPAYSAAARLQANNPTIDMETYAGAFTGQARIDRLLYIADHCATLKYDALLMALKYVKDNTFNTTAYQQIHAKLQETATSSGQAQVNGNGATNSIPDIINNDGAVPRGYPIFDPQWIDQTTKMASNKTEKLDSDLKGYKGNSLKESIRRGQDDLGDHYLDMGDLGAALKCYSRARDYCVNNKNIVDMCFNVIKVSAYLNNWSLVISYVNRAETTPDLSLPAAGKQEGVANTKRLEQITKLKCAAGLAELATKKYKSAARNFLQASFDHLEYSELVSLNNVAIYGSLCALATYDRQELQRGVISNTGFKQFLEVEPQFSEILITFYESKYATCLALLDQLRDNLLCDMYIAPHVDILYKKIRNRALIQYYSPYLSADMNKMAGAFNTSVNALEDELMLLILDGQIKARIDSHNKILYAKDVDQRASLFGKAMQCGKLQQQRTKALILRAAVLKAQIQVRNPSGPRGSGATSAAASSSSTIGGAELPPLAPTIIDYAITPSQSTGSSPTGGGM